MPRDPNKPVWSATGEHATQLFRDIYFDKYPSGTPALVAFQDPDRPYHKYSKEAFYRHYKQFLEKVSTYRTFGTGLNEKFRENCRLDSAPTPEETGAVLRAAGEDSESDDDDDDDYEDSHRDDCTVGAGFELESFLGNLNLNSNKDKKKETPKMPRTPSAPAVVEVAGNSFLGPQITECSGGNLAGTIPMLNGVDYEFSISENGKSIIQKVYIPETYLDAKKMFYRHGLTDQNVFIAGFQYFMDKQKRKPPVKVNESGTRYFEEMTLFSFPYEVERSFYDEQGNKVNKIFEGKGPGGLLWAFFYMKKRHEENINRTPAKIDRDNRRTRDNSGGDDAGGNFGRNVMPNTNSGNANNNMNGNNNNMNGNNNMNTNANMNNNINNNANMNNNVNTNANMNNNVNNNNNNHQQPYGGGWHYNPQANGMNVNHPGANYGQNFSPEMARQHTQQQYFLYSPPQMNSPEAAYQQAAATNALPSMNPAGAWNANAGGGHGGISSWDMQQMANNHMIQQNINRQLFYPDNVPAQNFQNNQNNGGHPGHPLVAESPKAVATRNSLNLAISQQQLEAANASAAAYAAAQKTATASKKNDQKSASRRNDQKPASKKNNDPKAVRLVRNPEEAAKLIPTRVAGVPIPTADGVVYIEPLSDSLCGTVLTMEEDLEDLDV